METSKRYAEDGRWKVFRSRCSNGLRWVVYFPDRKLMLNYSTFNELVTAVPRDFQLA